MNFYEKDRNTELLIVKDNIKKTMQGISTLNESLKNLKIRYANLLLYPFQIGEVVLCKVGFGCPPKEKKCVVEVQKGNVFARPFLRSGVLDRTNLVKQDYSKYFKKVEENV